MLTIDSSLNENGDWVSNGEGWKDVGVCRDEASESKINTVDNEVYIVSAIIYAPLSTPNVDRGTKIRVVNGDEVRLEKELVRFEKSQMHVRIWI